MNKLAIEAKELFAKLGEEMYAMTTTVHSANIPFDEQLRCIPSIWQMVADERDKMRKAEIGNVDKLKYGYDDLNIGLLRKDGMLLVTRVIPNPGLSNADWYAYARTVCDVLNGPR